MVAAILPLGPAEVNITGVRAGDVNAISVTINSGGVPVNLTGYTVAAHARKKQTDALPALVATVTITAPALGQLEMKWPGADVMALLGDALSWIGVWDLQIALSGNVQTVAAGTFQAVMDVTRP